MKAQIVAFLYPLVEDHLENGVDFIFNKTIDFIVEAEKKFDEGKDKKSFVVEKIQKIIDKEYDLGWFYGKMVNLFLKQVIDLIIEEINDLLDHNWIEKINQYKKGIKESLNL